MADLQVEQHPDKTFIGRIARGFEFLGYAFSPQGLGIAGQAVDRMLARVHQLYEQRASQQRLEAYVQRWLRWIQAGLRTPVLIRPLARCPEMIMTCPHRKRRTYC